MSSNDDFVRVTQSVPWPVYGFLQTPLHLVHAGWGLTKRQEKVVGIDQYLRQLFANDDGFGVSPFNTISIREKSDLLIGRHHVKTLGHNLSNDVRKEIVPPEARQAKVGQFPGHRAEGLVGVAA